jgi:hypothetical protein
MLLLGQSEGEEVKKELSSGAPATRHERQSENPCFGVLDAFSALEGRKT